MDSEKDKVIIAGLDIPFWDLVWLMVKLALASIPAIFILYFFFTFFTILFGGISNMMTPFFAV